MRYRIKHKDPRNLFGPPGTVGRKFRKAADIATSRQSVLFAKSVKQKTRAAGLGRLDGAIGETSSLKLRRSVGDPFGVVYARGGEEGRAGQALYAYSNGVTIRTRNKQWLAFQTDAIPRRAGPQRRRMTPELYKKFGFEQSLGKLIFKPISARKALLVIRNVTLQPKTGRAKPAGKRKSRTRVFKKETPAFILIKSTVRNKRIDTKTIGQLIAAKGPLFLAEALESLI